MIQAVLFDLDGTLADTALDLGGALNRLLARNGLPAVPMAQIRPVASHGANYLIKLGTGIEEGHPDHPRWRQEYLAEYEHGFAVVVSGDTCAESKPSTLPMHHACRQIGIAPERCLYVGDAERDMVAGKNAGMATALANWGYIAESDPVHEWPADARLDVPGQILDLL